MNFIDYAKSKGLDLHKDDIAFIKRILPDIPQGEHKALLRDYLKTWTDGMGLTENVVQKQNLGRRMANLSLLKAVGLQDTNSIK